MFDAKAFMEAKFERRVQDFPVPVLKSWFPKKEKPVWKIQSLNGKEIGLANEWAEKSGDLKTKIVTALTTANSPEVARKISDLMGNTEDKSLEFAKRIYYLHYGIRPGPFSGEEGAPACPLDMAVKICDQFPILFLNITTAILNLSGEGAISEKKLKPSGTTPK
jgi:hypothetical protein